MPRYCTGGGIRSSLSGLARLVTHDQGATGRGHGPAEVHRDLGVLDLTTMARRVVVGVHPFGGARAVIVHGTAQLTHVLDHHRHAVGVALAEVAARSIIRALAAELDDPARDVGAAPAFLAEGVLLRLPHRGGG